MRKRVIFLLTAALVVSLAMGFNNNATAAEKERVLKIGMSINEKSVFYKWAEKFKEVLEKESNGRYKINIYPNAQLGDDVKLVTQMRAGTVDGVLASTSNLTGVDKRWLVFDSFFLFPNDDVTHKVLDGPVGQRLLDSLPQYGIVGLEFGDYGFRHLTNSKREVKSPADAKGLKIRSQENPIHLASFKALGMNPTPMPFSEVFPGLQQGAIDGQENPLTIIAMQKLYEVQKYVTLDGHINAVVPFMFSKKTMDSLPKADQELIRKVAKATLPYERHVNAQLMSESLAILKNAGMVITELTAQQHSEFVNSTKDVIYKFQDQIGKPLIDEMNAEVAKYYKQK